MRLAILGTDADTIQLMRAAIRDGHSVDWIGGVRSEDTVAIAEIVPHLVDQADSWELILDQRTADAVIVGRGIAANELRAEQLKRLASEARATLVVHPATDSVLPYYEVDMARNEMGGLVQHYNPVAEHPIFAQLADYVRNGHPTAGTIHQVTCERRLTNSSRENAIHWLARDVEPIAAVAGDIRRVSAIGPKIGQPSFASLQIQMTCIGPASVRWSVGTPADADHDMAVQLVGERGAVTLLASSEDYNDHPRHWQLETIIGGQRHTESLPPHDAAQEAVRRFATAVHEPDGEARRSMATWNAATRAMEVVDAAELSLEKGRTLDVHQQQLTDRLAFRGTMSAIGCGVLVIGFIVFVAVSLFGAAEGKDRPLLISSWPIILLAVLAFFLLLQLAPLLVVKKKPTAGKREAATERQD